MCNCLIHVCHCLFKVPYIRIDLSISIDDMSKRLQAGPKPGMPPMAPLLHG